MHTSLFEQLGHTHCHSTSEEEMTLKQTQETAGKRAPTTLILVARATSELVHYLLKNIYVKFILSCTSSLTFMKAMTTLNHVGLCVSYWATWGCLRQLTAESNYREAVKVGRRLWV